MSYIVNDTLTSDFRTACRIAVCQILTPLGESMSEAVEEDGLETLTTHCVGSFLVGSDKQPVELTQEDVERAIREVCQDEA